MILDNRGLEPPQPMMRTLAALEQLERGQTLVILNDRRPMFLFEQLDEMGYLYLTEQQDDGSYKVTISQKAG
jgi:tRNA 2-thiouridine synthesizing protein A